jgi:glycosyltransferase involved in cell wall biosynthesis
VHDLQFQGVYAIRQYARRSGALIVADTHTDEVNSARSLLSRWILHGILYRHFARVLDPVVKRYYATLPLRATFLERVYGLSSDKIEILPFGVEDSRINKLDRNATRQRIREELKIGASEIVFVTGGKLDARKNIHILMKEFARAVDKGDFPPTKLLVFGQPSDEVRDLMAPYAHHEAIRLVDWVPAGDIHKLFWAGDVTVFPGTHSVLWEESIGLGLPGIFRRWSGIEHIDLGGNCILVDGSEMGQVIEKMIEVASGAERLERLRSVAQTLGPQTFNYSVIAKRSLDL